MVLLAHYATSGTGVAYGAIEDFRYRHTPCGCIVLHGYAMSGTDAAFYNAAGTRFRKRGSNVYLFRYVLRISAYVRATTCPVLT
eukprot:759027-Rhodomonas_salina.3